MPPKILHVFSTFAVGGPQVRFCQIVNARPDRYRHLLYAADGNYACQGRIHPDATVTRFAPRFQDGSLIRNALQARAALRQAEPDLLITYNWGAIEWALAGTVVGMPAIHVVDGFGPDEAHRQLARRVIVRRLALVRRTRLLVPSLTLVKLVGDTWRLPQSRVTYIPNGIETERFAAGPDPALLAGLRIPGERLVVGTLATLRPEKNLGRLLQALAALKDEYPLFLVIAGDGPERTALETEAASLGLSEMTAFTGRIDDPAKIVGAFDIFALSSETEQMPISILEAMAAGLPIASVDVGDVKAMVSMENAPFVTGKDVHALSGAIRNLLEDGTARRATGNANRMKARAEFALQTMVDRHVGAYDAAMAPE